MDTILSYFKTSQIELHNVELHDKSVLPTSVTETDAFVILLHSASPFLRILVLSFLISLLIRVRKQDHDKDILFLLRSALPGWSDVKDVTDIEIERVSGALTNCVFFVTALTETSKVFPRKILLRVHGVGVDEFVDRERELVFLEMLGSFNIGPSVLALFQNGRIEQFLPSTTLKNEDIRNQEISRRIGRLMANFI